METRARWNEYPYHGDRSRRRRLKPTAYHPIGAGVLEVANVPNIFVTRDDDVTHALDTFNDDADDSLDDDDDTDDTDDDERATKKTK